MSYETSFVTPSDFKLIDDFLAELNPSRTGRTAEWILVVFNQWMREQFTRTFFAKVCSHGKVVGVGALRIESELGDTHTEATLEAFRIHPDHRAGHVLRHLLTYTIVAGLMNRVLGNDGAAPGDADPAMTVRALVATDNLDLLDSLRRGGRFYKELALQEMELPRQAAPKPVDFGVRTVPASEATGAWNELQSLVRARECRRVALWEPPSSALSQKQPGAGFLFRDFALLTMTPERFSEAVHAGCVLDCQDRVNGQRVGGLLVVSPREMSVRYEATTQIQAMAVRHEYGPPELAARSHDVLIRSAMLLAAKRDHRLMLGPYIGDELVCRLQTMGFAPDRWHQTVVLRKTLSGAEARGLVRQPLT